ncbi:MAG: YfiR family protein [Deltaproteobacteria bacterium]|nr:YfiR family protein [Deltaproteobacteria bacterium]
MSIMNVTILKMVRLLFCFILILSWVIMPQVSRSSEHQNAQKKKISALYLYNFLLFVDWPKIAVSHSDTIKVVIYGDPHLYEALKPMADKMIRGKKLIVDSLTKSEDLDNSCQVLFVGHKEKPAVRGLLKKVNGKPILTVSDMEGFVHLGGMVGFKDRADSLEKGKKQKRFIINLPAVRKPHLKIRSRLLRISDVVYDDIKPVTYKQP